MSPRFLRLAALAFLFAGTAGLRAQPATPPPLVAEPATDQKKGGQPKLVWHDVTTWGVEGRAFGDLERKRWFDRLPAEAEGKVTAAVWRLSRDSAGMLVHFRTDSPTIWADYGLTKEQLAGVNMTAIG